MCIANNCVHENAKKEIKLLKWKGYISTKYCVKYFYIWEYLNNMIKVNQGIYLKTHIRWRYYIWIYIDCERTVVEGSPFERQRTEVYVTDCIQKLFIGWKRFGFQSHPLHHYNIHNETIANQWRHKKLMFMEKEWYGMKMKEWERRQYQEKDMERSSPGSRPPPKYWSEKEKG